MHSIRNFLLLNSQRIVLMLWYVFSPQMVHTHLHSSCVSPLHNTQTKQHPVLHLHRRHVITSPPATLLSSFVRVCMQKSYVYLMLIESRHNLGEKLTELIVFNRRREFKNAFVPVFRFCYLFLLITMIDC